MDATGNRHGRNSKQCRSLRLALFAGRNTAPCCFCRRELHRGNATLEHVIPVSQGGNWSIDNLRLSCKTCNNERGVIPFEEYKARWKRRRDK